MENNVLLRKLERKFDEKIYNMLFSMPFDVNGFINDANNLSEYGFKKWIIKMIKLSNGIISSEDEIPQTIYIIYNNDEPAGIIKLRHKLSEKGGHIGIGLHYNHIGKGLGTMALNQATDILYREHGINNIKITIHKDNVASRKMAEKNGFNLHDIKEGIRCEYWKKIYA